jgi:hypothetical protein
MASASRRDEACDASVSAAPDAEVAAPNSMDTTLDLVLLAGTPFSGSTILQAELGRCAELFVLGEVDRLRAFARHEHLSGDAAIYLDECEYCLLSGSRCPIWTPETLASIVATGGTPDLYRVAAAATGRRVIVDGSKSPHWVASILGSSGLEGIRVHLVHCVKHPFAYALSLSKRTGWPEPHCVFDWMLVNSDVLEIAAGHGARLASSTLVRVEDFERDPEATIASIGRQMNLSFDATIAPHNLHFLGGNRRSGTFPASKDPYESSDWRERIGPDLRQRFAGLPGVAPLASSLGYPLL